MAQVINTDNSNVRTILTGDRPTGRLHLGHFVGSLKSRVQLQEKHRQFILVADMQALTDNNGNPAKVRENVLEVVTDYLAVGIDHQRTTICLQSALPAISELAMLYLNFTTVARLERNPTIRSEIVHRGFERSVPAGFLCYPVSQAADITAFDADLVPVGEDQAPLIELANEIVTRVNNQSGKSTLKNMEGLYSETPRLPGVDGKSKMSKSSSNSITLGSSPEEIRAAVRQMYTDPKHIRVSDPGTVEGNVVFSFLDAFDQDKNEVDALKEHYRAGGLGDMVLKRRLEDLLQSLLEPIREQRKRFAADPEYVLSVLRTGTEKSRDVTSETLCRVRKDLGHFIL
ncbi:tryptophan--tRNA ligase [Thalassospira xiamenensis]|uniref:Tryptophan--tRNA ligase n=1 Tax=Thalassospira xiamenensis TaxID=220697 RepID=A0A285TS96_9PROT|nr:tryptophan--tRNA ligase [Thalassospira xiamenensis]SOC26678.1 tryptophanyl-tRNA synthetase [Thalassospira xiamenensis]